VPSRTTIKKVAQKTGVSIASVSRFLNHPHFLKEETRRKIEKVVKRLKYSPLSVAQRLAGGKLNIFGLIIPGYEGIFYSFYAWEIIRGIAYYINEKGVDLYLHIFWGKDTFKASFVDGVIFADVIGNEKQLRRLVREGIPTVVINKKITEPEVSCVAIDNFKGAYEATEFLTNHGHRKIAHLAGDLRIQCAQERLEGFRACLEKNKIEVKEEFIKITNFSPRQARQKLEELFSYKEIPTAIFCCSDEVAKEALSFAKERDISVPKKLSVIGFDDNPLLGYGDSMLTTIRQPFNKMTSLAIKILHDRIREKKPLQRIVLPCELIIRDTVSFV